MLKSKPRKSKDVRRDDAAAASAGPPPPPNPSPSRSRMRPPPSAKLSNRGEPPANAEATGPMKADGLGGPSSAARRKKRRKGKGKRRSETQSNELPSTSTSNPSSAAAVGKGGRTFSLMDGGVDILQGLEMHQDAVSEDFERDLISFVQKQCERGRRGDLRKPTYLRSGGARSQGNRREAIMYGGFFDFNRARPGKRGLVPPFPPILERLVDHLVSNGYLPANVRPDSCIINHYGRGDCIPPHVDHGSYHRPISTLSLLGEEPMLLGSKFRTVEPCVWTPIVGQSIPLPRRSLLVLGGNSGNVAKHCISACGGKRISITLRKQPPPDWRPDAEELFGGMNGDKSIGRWGSGGKRWDRKGKGDDKPQKKRKALSGSAKRRKKMMKLIMAKGGAA